MVRLRRNILGVSQTDLGKALGVAFQQVQKYEKGTNRIGASWLYRLSQILKVPVNYFFDDLSTAKVSPTRVFDADLLAQRETTGLIRAYYRITDTGVRRQIMALMNSLAPRPGKAKRKMA